MKFSDKKNIVNLLIILTRYIFLYSEYTIFYLLTLLERNTSPQVSSNIFKDLNLSQLYTT